MAQRSYNAEKEDYLKIIYYFLWPNKYYCTSSRSETT